MVRVANTSSILWEVSFSLEVSLGAGGRSSEPWIASLLTSPAFEVYSACFAPSVIAPIAREALGGLAVEFEELWGCMTGGSICFLPSSARKKPQPRLGWGLHPIPRHNKSCTWLGPRPKGCLWSQPPQHHTRVVQLRLWPSLPCPGPPRLEPWLSRPLPVSFSRLQFGSWWWPVGHRHLAATAFGSQPVS